MSEPALLPLSSNQSTIMSSPYRGLFFIGAGILSFLVTEFFEDNLRSLLWSGLLTSLLYLVSASLMYKKQKLNRSDYLASFAVPALFIAFTFWNPFIAIPLVKHLVLVLGALLIATIPYTQNVFVAEAVSLGLISMTLLRFLVIFGTSWIVIIAIFLFAAGALSALVLIRLEHNRTHLKLGWPVALVVLTELFIVFLIIPINIPTRAILLGTSFYIYFKGMCDKHKEAEPMRALRTDAILLGLLYIALLVSAHWI